MKKIVIIVLSSILIWSMFVILKSRDDPDELTFSYIKENTNINSSMRDLNFTVVGSTSLNNTILEYEIVEELTNKIFKSGNVEVDGHVFGINVYSLGMKAGTGYVVKVKYNNRTIASTPVIIEK